MVSNIRRTLLACLQVYKQWGVIRNSSYSTSWVQSITFPIRFKLAYIAIANAYDVDRTGDHKAEFGCHAFNLTTSGLSYCYHGSAGGDCSDTATYIAIGQAQQWGRSTAATLNFSLPFQKFYCITTAQESWGSATFDNTSWITRTNISVTWPTYQGTNINYIAVGMQQCFKRCAFGKAQALPMDSHQKPAQPLPLS